MKIADVIRLLALAAIWGASFIFMRVLAPVLGPVWTTCLRVLISSLVLLTYYQVAGISVDWRKNWYHYIVIGLVNTAVPFVLFSYAALYIPASISVILNATSPLFGVILSAVFLKEGIALKKILGLSCGIGGVALVALKGDVDLGPEGFGSVISCLLAALCYALAGLYIKMRGKGLKPLPLAGASQMCSALSLLPFALPYKFPGDVTIGIVVAMLALALLCTAVAYVLYFRLISDIGPARALTVTFLMPAFGMVWGSVFLGEVITAQMIVGAAAIVSGTALVVSKK